MKKLFKKLSVVCSFLLVLSCADDEVSKEAKEIGIDAHNEKAFSGTFDNGVMPVSYEVSAPEELIFNVGLTINSKELKVAIDYEQENITFQTNGAVLTKEEKGALLDTGASIADFILKSEEGKISMLEYALLSSIQYLSNAPQGYAHANRTVEGPGDTSGITSRDEGITCIRKGTYVNAQYDDSRGSHSDRVKVGSSGSGYKCIGRCGVECGRWWIPSAWTKDCLDHDQCSLKNNSTSGPLDRNCGDEYTEAADDYLFGVVRGCSG
ncbi:hypothetical protein ACJD0Z_15660 [Flavobacteriaceae bacterium M23B6Z8]